MIARISDATAITAIIAAFFLILALITLARTIFRTNPPSAKRFRVGVFIERDHVSAEDDEDG